MRKNHGINIWQGSFPNKNTEADGFFSTSPVCTFAPNGYHPPWLYDMSGNVWEWVSDWYHSDAYAIAKGKGIVKNPTGPATSYDPDEPYLSKRVIRGGSFLCNDSYCLWISSLTAARGSQTENKSVDTSANRLIHVFVWLRILKEYKILSGNKLKIKFPYALI